VSYVLRRFQELKHAFQHLDSNEKLKKKTLNQLRTAVPELYLLSKKIENFKELNFVGFKKICKKFDKNLLTNEGSLYFKERIQESTFHKNGEIFNLLDRIENFMTWVESNFLAFTPFEICICLIIFES
jgi:SPX domain protein involved in polyphosphate accumulation